MNSKENILKRLLENGKVSAMEGTLTYNSLTASSIEFENCYLNAEENLNMCFPQLALENGYSEELELKCNEFSVYRKKGNKATGIITIEGIKDTEILKDTLVQTKLNLQYKTLEDTKINENGIANIPIQAVKEGTEFNVKANTIVEMPVQFIGISKIYNKEDIVNGRDTETDENLYKRFLIKVQTPSTSGNVYDYMNWSLEINGVGNAIVKPLWNGNGTIKVILVNSSWRCPSSEIIKNVKENIEKKRPIGATVTVVGVQEKDITVTYKAIHEGDPKEIKKEIIENIKMYLSKIALKSNVVRFNRIANCILNVNNVIDYKELKINNDTKDITLEDDTIAVLKEVVDNET
ncbi:baseplate J protein (endogenous virus) [Clostridium phage phiCT453B]|uniref:tail protein n=1 Tax=Clostridium phage phiCT453B TaxID=1567013 RepID=UPI000572A8A9|nr:baseplate J/gp47 family protein [Clostridium tetani]YP_009217946.1 tail protein [Clostridium phage phiCT453B]AJA42602.1 baseplate J protein [Clostridium phage phiCT453B]